MGCGENSVASGPVRNQSLPRSSPEIYQERKQGGRAKQLLTTDLRCSILMSLTSHGPSVWWRTRGRYLHVGRSSDLDQQQHVSFVITTPFHQPLQTVRKAFIYSVVSPGYHRKKRLRCNFLHGRQARPHLFTFLPSTHNNTTSSSFLYQNLCFSGTFDTGARWGIHG